MTIQMLMLKRVLFIILLFVVFSGSVLGVFYGLRYWQSLASVSDQFAGRAFFISSGQLNESNNQGNNDELQIELHYIPDPAPGDSYYAWLLSDKSQNSLTALLLNGALPVNHGEVHVLYRGTPQHTNLIAITSRLLITEEKANTAPTHPTSDQNMWRYYAELPQGRQPQGNVPTQGMLQPTALDCLRALLYEEQNISKLGIHGGLNIQLLKNTGKILEWIYSARASSDPYFRHRQLVRTLDYLDGSVDVQLDTPPGTPLLVEQVPAQVPLLDRIPNQPQASYLDLVGTQLAHLLAVPDITPATRTLVLQIKQALSGNIPSWFALIRHAATTLAAIPEAQLLQPQAQSLLDTMIALSNVAFVGRLDPATNELQPGIVQVFYDIQRLASFDIKPFSS